jgi:hypothetical protein
MKRAAFVVLAAAFLACRKPAPKAPAAEALGAELATFRQVLVPLTQQTLTEFQDAVSLKGAENVTLMNFRQTYEHGTATVDGSTVALFIAYAGPFQAPKGTPLQAMSVQQFLGAFAGDPATDIATLAAPKGNIFFTRQQLPDVIGAARAAGASSGDLPFSLIYGNGR